MSVMNDESPLSEAAMASSPSHARAWWWDELPYLAMLLLSLGGVAYTSIAPQASSLFWTVLAVAFGCFCVAAGWKRARGKQARWRLLWTQGLHWGALLLCMQLLFIPDMQRMLNTDAIGLALIALMSLGTFLAGVHAASWRICVAALLMAVAAPAIAFIEQAALLLLPVELLIVVAIVAFIWWRRGRSGERASL